MRKTARALLFVSGSTPVGCGHPCSPGMDDPCHFGGAELCPGDLRCLPSEVEEEPGVGRCALPCESDADCRRETSCTIDQCEVVEDVGHCRTYEAR